MRELTSLWRARYQVVCNILATSVWRNNKASLPRQDLSICHIQKYCDFFAAILHSSSFLFHASSFFNTFQFDIFNALFRCYITEYFLISKESMAVVTVTEVKQYDLSHIFTEITKF